MADTDNDPPTDSDPVPPGELEADTSREESPDETEDESAEPAARASSAGTDGSGSGESGSGGAEASGSGSDSDSHAGSGGSGSGDSNAASENTTDASGSHREHHGSNPFGKPSEPDDAPPRLSFIQRVRRRLNIYSLAFILIILIAVAIALVTYEQSRRAASNQVKTQGISQSTLEQLANSDATVGSNQTVLNVKSSAIFAG